MKMKIYKVLLVASGSIALLSGCVNQNEAEAPTALKAPACTGQTGVLHQITHQK